MQKFRVEFNFIRHAENFVEAFEERIQGVNYPIRIASHNGEYPISWCEEGEGSWTVYLEAVPVRMVTESLMQELTPKEAK